MRFAEKLEKNQLSPLEGTKIEILQANLGYRCNMACKHCHVQAAPDREEMMDEETVSSVLNVLEKNDIKILDITGGAPELNPHFPYLVQKTRQLGKHVIVRSNLTIFFERGMEELSQFYRDQEVEVIASLPYYLEENVDRVRGSGTFEKSIHALRKLNELGYGCDNGLHLNLVYNPQGAFLPPSQCSLEEEYKNALKERFAISFNKLYTFTNMPIGRFKEFLIRSNNYHQYMEKLISAFNPETLKGIMCKYLVSVGWDGKLYDCDFNQIVGLAVLDGSPQYIQDFDYNLLSQRPIAVDDHCYGCTAGQGST